MWLDGVYASEPGRGDCAFREDAGVTDADVQRLVVRVRDRVEKAMRGAGKWWDANEATEVGGEPSAARAFAAMRALFASLWGRAATR